VGLKGKEGRGRSRAIKEEVNPCPTLVLMLARKRPGVYIPATREPPALKGDVISKAEAGACALPQPNGDGISNRSGLGRE
jgi:hypothetical protein